MSTTIDDIEEAIEFVDEWEQVMKAERVIARGQNLKKAYRVLNLDTGLI